MRSTQVAIIGAGPSGLLLAQLLRHNGIDSVVLECRSQDHVQARIRAGLLEWTTVELLKEAGVGERMLRDGLVHDGFDVAFAGGRHRIDLKGLTGRSVLVYGQTELQKDLVRSSEPGAVLWQVAEVVLHEWDTRHPRVTYSARRRTPGAALRLHRRLRWRPRRQPRGHTAGEARAVRARVPVRMARAAGRRAAPATRSSCTPVTSAALPCAACARAVAAVTTCSARSRTRWRSGPTAASGTSCTRACRGVTPRGW